MYYFSDRSLEKLNTCDIKLQELFKKAIERSPFDFAITHGHRSPAEQFELYKQGREKPGKIITYKDGYKKLSKHNHLPSQAVDVAIFIDKKLTWEPINYIILSEHIIDISIILNIEVEWGGNWHNFKDYPHYQIN